MPNTLKLAVLGDSVPWGQGLLEEHKYSYQIAAQLCQSVASDLCLTAHSGATIGAGDNGGHDTANAEIPISAPTILNQIDKIPNPSEFDVVLLNGGINDVNIRTILNPLTKKSSLHQNTVNACYRDMKTLLSKSAGVFKKSTCRFVVTGYYPILSPNSDLDLFEGVDAFGHLLGIYGLGFPLHLDQTLVLNQVCSLTMQFWKDSDAALAKAVTEMASQLNLNNRMIYVPGPFAEENALFADDTWLFGFDSNLAPADEVVKQRTTACDLYYSNPFDILDREVCHYASVGHPNVKGAKRIGETILNSI